LIRIYGVFCEPYHDRRKTRHAPGRRFGQKIQSRKTVAFPHDGWIQPMLPHFAGLERFSNVRGVTRIVQGGFFLRKKSLKVGGFPPHQLENRYRPPTVSARRAARVQDGRNPAWPNDAIRPAKSPFAAGFCRSLQFSRVAGKGYLRYRWTVSYCIMKALI
jgi:hypothetical protein